jgi:hypothetical protein
MRYPVLRVTAGLLLCLAVPLAEGKKGGKKVKSSGHVNGTVTALDSGQITVVKGKLKFNAKGKGKGKGKHQPKVYSFPVTPNTAVTDPSGRPLPGGSLGVGSHVSVEYQLTGAGAVATRIKVLGKKR